MTIKDMSPMDLAEYINKRLATVNIMGKHNPVEASGGKAELTLLAVWASVYLFPTNSEKQRAFKRWAGVTP